MTCCDHCQDAENWFDRTKAEDELREYRKSGPPNKSTRLLIDALRTLDLDGRRLLDVGGGVGIIPCELLADGIAESTLVEASPAYLEVAENEARRRGFAERTTFEYGDVVDLAPNLPEADLVTLDRVFCCYPHLEELVQASAGRATRWYGVTYPRERWHNKIIEKLAGVYCWARDAAFRMYVHEEVEETIRAQGFEPFYQIDTMIWRVELYERRNGTE